MPDKIINQYRGEPILDCLVIFCKLQNRPYTHETLISGLPIEEGRNTPILFSKNSSKSLFSRAAAKAGFKTKIHKTKLLDINPLVLPCMLLLNGTEENELNACILLDFDDEMQNARIILPEFSDVEHTVSIEKLSSLYYGLTLLLKKEIRIEEKELGIQGVKESHWLWGTFKVVKKIYIDALIASFLINIFVLVTPLFTMNIYDRVVPNGAIETLWVLSIGVIVIYIVDVMLKFLRSYFLEIAGKKTDIIASSIIFEKVLDLRLSSLPNSVGSLANILKEFESIRGFLTSSTVALLIDLPFVIIFLFVVYYIAGPIVIIPIITINIMIIYTYFAKKKLTLSIKETYGASSNKNGILIESLSSIETLKAIGGLGFAQWKWEESTSNIADKSVNTKFLSASINTITAFLLQLNTVIVIIAGVYMISDMTLTMGGLIATVIITSRVIAPMGQVASLLSVYEHTKASFEALDTIMNLPVEHPYGKKFIMRAEYTGKIEFKDVSFSYPQSAKSSINNISFKINPGEKVAIIGKIGSGKSTIQKLISSLYYASSGSILIDDIDIKQLEPSELRKNIAYVAQDTLLFNGTVRENLIYRVPNASDDEIIKAAEISGVLDFVKKDPKGFDIPVGEKGKLLSGGQIQSIGIARAILLNCPIVLLDEPTNQMDMGNESKFIEKIKNYLGEDKTLLLVTHKTSLLELVDRVIVIEDGKIVMDGSKENIINKIRK
jgi:ATP-binding cassette subfamily C protein LapB